MSRSDTICNSPKYEYLINLLMLNLNAYLSLLVVEIGLPQQSFGDESPPNRRLNCTGFYYNWPPPSPQSTTTASIPKSWYTILPRECKIEPPNEGTPPHPPYHSLNRTKPWKGNHMHTLHVSHMHTFHVSHMHTLHVSACYTFSTFL